jgi:hypothetical protein
VFTEGSTVYFKCDCDVRSGAYTISEKGIGSLIIDVENPKEITAVSVVFIRRDKNHVKLEKFSFDLSA